MAGLQRFISYIYRYENDEKIANAGFAKVEVRGSVCHIEVHIRGIMSEQKDGTVYLFFRKDRILYGVPVGSIAVTRGNGDVRYSFETKDLAEFHTTMEQMEGIFIPISEEGYLASQWKEGEIKQTYFKVVEKGEPLEEAEISEEVIIEAENVDTQEEAEEIENRSDDEIRPIHTTEIPLEKFQSDDNWERVFRRFRMQRDIFFPFEGKQIECVRLEIKDIKIFPEKYWYLGNNSFLLHGFFNYGHFILGEMNNKGRTEYFIGVPGVFLNQERIMASMFGFPEFQTAANAGHKTGNFGYWYRII